MGVTTGLLGGFTLTTTIIYLSMSMHRRNRLYQSALLHQQALLLNNVVEPQPPAPPAPSREVPAGLLETAKDKWNAELEKDVRKLQNVDWDDVRERMEEGVSSLWRRAFSESRKAASEASSEASKQLDKQLDKLK